MRRDGAPIARMRGALVALVALALAGGLAAPPARAQEPAVKNLTLLSIPSATVAPRGLGFGSLGLTSRRGGTGNSWDGSMALGVGLGDAAEGLGLQITANITSLSNNFGDSGYFEAKIARLIAPGNAPFYIAAQVEGLARWGQARTVPERGRIMGTWFTDLSAGGDVFPVMMTLGYGTHLRNGRTDPGIFAGAGIGLTRNLGVSAAWTGETLDVGAAWRFEDAPGMTLSAEINDVTDRLGSRRFSITFSFFRPNLYRS